MRSSPSCQVALLGRFLVAVVVDWVAFFAVGGGFGAADRGTFGGAFPCTFCFPTDGEPGRSGRGQGRGGQYGRILDALKQELARSIARLRLRNYEAPYYISYTLRDGDNSDAEGRFRALYSQGRERSRVVRVEVRVGSYDLDNTSVDEDDGGDFVLSLSNVSKDAPLDDDLDALRATLWQITDYKYKQAIAAYAQKRARGVKRIDPEDKVASFSREPVQKAILPAPPFVVDEAGMAEAVRQIGAPQTSAGLIGHGQGRGRARDPLLRVQRRRRGRRASGAVECAPLGADAGQGRHDADQRPRLYSPQRGELPTTPALVAAMDGLVRDLTLLQSAPAADPYNGPAILMEEAAGVFFHETIGHRLEGERQGNEQEGRTFKGQIGKPVLPDFISIIDDPTQDRVTVTPVTLAGSALGSPAGCRRRR